MTEETVKILSAGAPKTGVARCAEEFAGSQGQKFTLEFATAPVLRERILNDNPDIDIVIAPEKAFTQFKESAKLVENYGGRIGAVKAAVVIRKNSHKPDLTSAATLKQAIIEADGLVYNKASSGQYIEKMIGNLGLVEIAATKTVRTSTGAGVMEHLTQSLLEFEIGFGQITEIQVQIDKRLGVELVGPLPKKVENITTYYVGLLQSSGNKNNAKALVDYMLSDEGEKIFRATGVL